MFPRQLVVLWLAAAIPAQAHNGPPFPIIEGRKVGPCTVALWTHPDVGIGTFFVLLDPLPGKTVPKDLKVEIGVQPVTGRLPERFYAARLDDLRGQVQYKAEVPFDKQERWRVHLRLSSAQASGEAEATVEVTPPGLGRWDLLWFVAPFAAVGFLWFRALSRRRNYKRAAPAKRD